MLGKKLMNDDMDCTNLPAFHKNKYDEDTIGINETIKVYYHSYDNYGKIEPHYHEFSELNIIIKGNGIHYVGDKSFPIERGTIFIIPPDVIHGYDFTDNDYVIFHILFKNDFFKKYESFLTHIYGYNVLFGIEPIMRLHSEYTNNLFCFGHENDPSFFGIIDRLNDLNSSDSPNLQSEKEFLTLYLISVISENIKEYQKQTINNNALSTIIKTTDYIRLNYNKKITLKDLCDETHMSRSALLRNFYEVYKTTPLDFLTKYRINQAKLLLKTTDYNISDIAQSCGFFDSSHFTKLFSKSEGISPSKFRKQYSSAD